MESIQEQINNNQFVDQDLELTSSIINSAPNPILTQVPIYQTSTDHKPLCTIGFVGGYNNCLGFLHRGVKPIIGVVKYDFTTWGLFPTTVTQSRELALKWSNSFEKRKDFVNKSVIIFFHLQMKTIRIEVKEKSPTHN